MKKMFFAALAATMMFASCNKDDIKIDIEGDGEGTKMGLSFTLPIASEARNSEYGAGDGVDIDAIGLESDIQSIQVFVFNANGTLPANGAVSSFSITDFDHDGSGTYSLKEANRIQTTAGSKYIYVAANIPTLPAVSSVYDLQTAIESAGWNSVTNEWGIPSTGFVMCSPQVSQTLVPQEENTIDTTADPENIVKTTLERTVAKLVVTSKTLVGKIQQDFPSYTQIDGTPVGLKMDYEIQDWGAGAVAKSYFIAQNHLSNPTPGVISTPNSNRTSIIGGPSSGARINKTVTPIMSAPIWKDMASFSYIGENRPDGMLYGEATTVMIRTQAEPTHVAILNASNDIEWVTATGVNALTNGTFYLVRNEVAGAFFCKSTADVSAITSKLPGTITRTKSWEYDEGYAYFMVTVNISAVPDATYKAVVYRNQFINIHITGIIDDYFGAIPGIPGSPEDPEDPEGEVPDPFDPEEPIIEDNAYLLVEVSAAPWVFYGEDVILK